MSKIDDYNAQRVHTDFHINIHVWSFNMIKIKLPRLSATLLSIYFHVLLCYK